MTDRKRNYIKTPIFKSHKLLEEYNLNVRYKMECFQPSGSFKVRGMDTLVKALSSKGHKKVIATSGGNAGYSLAYVAKQLGIAVELIVPETTSKYMISKIKLLDAKVEVYGKSWDDTNRYALQISKKTGLPYIPPFDHPLLWQGHSSIIDECAQEMLEPDKIVVAVGGGGLLCGVFEGLLRNNWINVKVVTAETEGAASFAKSFDAGRPVELNEITTIATSLGARRIANKTLDYASKFRVEPYVTNDIKAFNACKDFFDEYHILVEPACGAALSYVRSKQNGSTSNENILVIVCGGVNMGMEKFLEYTQKIK